MTANAPIVWHPSEAAVAEANVTRLMQKAGVEGLEADGEAVCPEGAHVPRRTDLHRPGGDFNGDFRPGVNVEARPQGLEEA